MRRLVSFVPQAKGLPERSLWGRRGWGAGQERWSGAAQEGTAQEGAAQRQLAQGTDGSSANGSGDRTAVEAEHTVDIKDEAGRVVEREERTFSELPVYLGDGEGYHGDGWKAAGEPLWKLEEEKAELRLETYVSAAVNAQAQQYRWAMSEEAEEAVGMHDAMEDQAERRAGLRELERRTAAGIVDPGAVLGQEHVPGLARVLRAGRFQVSGSALFNPLVPFHEAPLVPALEDDLGAVAEQQILYRYPEGKESQ